MFMSGRKAREIFEPDKMKRKYLDYYVLSALGVPEEQIPEYSGNQSKGEETLSLTEALQDIELMMQMLASSPQNVVKFIDNALSACTQSADKENQDFLGMHEIAECMAKVSDKKIDHSRKYEKIKELEQKKAEMKKALSMTADVRSLQLRIMEGQMMCKYDQAIQKLRQAIKINQPDCEEMLDDDELMVDETDCYGVPDSMAKRLLFERGMMPYEEGADAVLAELYGW